MEGIGQAIQLLALFYGVIFLLALVVGAFVRTWYQVLIGALVITFCSALVLVYLGATLDAAFVNSIPSLVLAGIGTTIGFFLRRFRLR